MYEVFSKYLNDPVMTKIKNVEGYSVYMTKTYCLLSNQCRYIVVIIPVDGEDTGNKERLSRLRWISLQTRTLEDKHDLESHYYTPVAEGPLTSIIYKVKSNDVSSTYNCDDFPIVVTLLSVEKQSNEYQNRGTIIAALETWQTIITLSNNR
jgi:hypothetical protein